MQREEMIEALTVDSMLDIFDRRRLGWLQEILENGFPGFARMSDDDLRHEIWRRGLDRTTPEAWDDGDETYGDDLVMQAGYGLPHAGMGREDG